MLAFLTFFPLRSPIYLSYSTLRHLVLCPRLSLLLVSLPCFVYFSWQYKHVVFNIFSVLALNLTCLFYFLLPFTSRGKRMPISCCVFRLIVRWHFGLWQEADHVLPRAQVVAWDHWLFWSIFLSLSLSFKLSNSTVMGQVSWLCCFCAPCKGHYILWHYTACYVIFSSIFQPVQSVIHNYLFPLRNPKFLDTTISVYE